MSTTTDPTASQTSGTTDGGDPVFAAFCAAGLWPGLGRTTAGKLGDAGIVGPDDVSRARLATVPGVAPARAERLTTSFAAAAPAYEVVRLLTGAGLPARLGHALIAELGGSAPGDLENDPWRLLAGGEADLSQADRLAVSLGVGRSDLAGDERRGPAVLLHLLRRAARAGDTAADGEALLAAGARDGVPDPTAALSTAVGEGLAVIHGDLVALERYARAEETVAEGVARLLATAEPLRAKGRKAKAGTRTSSTELDATQLRAVDAALEHGVSLLTGGPGTGKSRTVAAVVELAGAAGARVALAAPTGRAAKRLEELAGAPAMTLHRLLQAQGRGGGFARGEDWPLDAELVVVDEASMLDAELAAALLEACADGTHLLVVGDPAQLPSIGAGRVLGDLVESGLAPVTELTTLYRQEEGGAIARLATAVRGGELPPPVDDGSREVVVVPARESGEAAHRTVQLVTDSIPRVLGIPAADVQVVTPVHRGPAGTMALNAALKKVLNPGTGTVGGFDVGDRVVATANHMDDGFANGEVGVVTAAPGGAPGSLTVTFPAGPVEVPPTAVNDLTHGWAITVHRAQGSEWPAVVTVLPPEAGTMLSRPLVYTALTRARRHLSVVAASGPALRRAVREVGGRRRTTLLAPMLADAAREAEQEAQYAADDGADGQEG